VTTISELIDRWNSDEGKPYKGSLIDYAAYKPGELGCMCAQGQVLHVVAGWSVDQLRNTEQTEADLATAKALNISRAHAVLLRNINDNADGAPSIVLTDPGKVLGDQWSRLLDFWHYMDGLDSEGWQKVAAARAAAWDAARAAAWDAAWEIQGSAILAAEGRELFFLPMFGFASPEAIPAQPSDYAIQAAYDALGED